MKKTNDALYQEHQIIIDVRTPSEYNENHIMGSINIPLFSDEERKIIGTAYKQQSPFEAKKLGLEFMGNRLKEVSHQIMDLSKEEKEIIIYCAKGGMRSASIVALMNSLDIPVYQLEGGMKGHREYMVKKTEEVLSKKTFITLHGLTGVGKTKLLLQLREKGLSVLDYEGLANHAGSVFGRCLFTEEMPSQKYFEEKLFYELIHTKDKYIFIESESRRVGSVFIPDIYMEMLANGRHILIETSMENRIDNLMDDYIIDDENKLLIEGIDRLRKRISNEKADELIQYVKEDNLSPVVDFLLASYYDPLYQYSIDKYEYDEKISYKELDHCVTEIIDFREGINE